jgi:hypothetical protein
VIRVVPIPPADHEPLQIILGHLPEGRGVTKDDISRWRYGFRLYRERTLLGKLPPTEMPAPPPKLPPTTPRREPNPEERMEAVRRDLEQSLRGKWQA